MYNFFVSPEAIDELNQKVRIQGSDVNHIKNVLRMKIGEELSVSNGMDGKAYDCKIISISGTEVLCELIQIIEESVELPSEIYLFQGLPKSDKMELIIQKAVELGVYEVIPMSTKRAIVKLDEKKAKTKLARWQSVAESAAKQSKRRVIPQIKNVMSFGEALTYAEKLDIKIIPYELAKGIKDTKHLIEEIKVGQKVGIFIGPEGGFEELEIEKAMEKGIVPITLGKRILRTETAGFTILSWLMYQLEE